jgi:cation diffusion facilitator family transporter
VFLGKGHEKNERRTWLVIFLTGGMMVAEITGGVIFGSMALLADGLHMATHAGAMLIAAAAYAFSRKYVHDARFSFGTGKVGDLAGFTSAIILAVFALLIGYESILRLFNPVPIAFNEAIPIAILGLIVNLVCAWLLKDDHHHHHGHQHHGHAHSHDHDDHDHEHEEHRHAHYEFHGGEHAHDVNLRAAYVHVLADALVSVGAIIGLLAGRQLGWIWMDPLMGIAGMIVIGVWSIDLMRTAGAMLLDMHGEGGLAAQIGELLETDEDKIVDLHVWRLGPGHHAALVGLVCRNPCPPSEYKERLNCLTGLSHVTVEVEPWPEGDQAQDLR